MTVWQVTALQLVGLFAMARVMELVSSAIRSRIARDERGARPLQERWWPLIVATHVLVLGGSALFIVLRGNVPPPTILAAAMTALVFATALRAWMFIALRHSWNVRVIDPGKIVTTGPYRYIRHPNYLAVILEVAALPLLVGAYEIAVLATAANALVLSWRIPFEEATLARHHRVYRDVMMTRPRFVPRLGWGGATDVAQPG